MPGRKRRLLKRLEAFHATAATLHRDISAAMPEQHRDLRSYKWPQAGLWLAIEAAATRLEDAIGELRRHTYDRLEGSRSVCVEPAAEDAEADDTNGNYPNR